MKISEARSVYTAQINQQREQREKLLKQQEELKKQRESGGEGGVVLELSEEYCRREKELQEKVDALSELIEQNEESRERIINMEVGIANAESSRQQADAMKKYGEDMAKCLEIARRISEGDKVPPQDEKKLMDFNREIYMAAKSMAVMNQQRKHKEYDSLWDEEEKEEQKVDPLEKAANTEISAAAPAEMPQEAGDAAAAE